jgi:hypothetical protein
MHVSEVNPNEFLGASRNYFGCSRSAVGLPANVGRCVQLGPFGRGKKARREAELSGASGWNLALGVNV